MTEADPSLMSLLAVQYPRPVGRAAPVTRTHDSTVMAAHGTCSTKSQDLSDAICNKHDVSLRCPRELRPVDAPDVCLRHGVSAIRATYVRCTSLSVVSYGVVTDMMHCTDGDWRAISTA